MDGSLLEAWASLKSFRPKDKPNAPGDVPSHPTADFHGEKRSNETHESKTDPDALLARKGKGKVAKLSCNGNLLVENRNGLIVNAELLQANGRAERDAALVMLEQVPGDGRITVGGDKGSTPRSFVGEWRQMNATPHVAQNDGRRGDSTVDVRTTRHARYAASQKKRKRIEECFGWLKDILLLRKLKHRGRFKVRLPTTWWGYAISFRFRLRPDEAVVSLRAAKNGPRNTNVRVVKCKTPGKRAKAREVEAQCIDFQHL